MDDYRLALMVGIDIPIPELQIAVHPPTIRDIAFMGENEFFQTMQYICLDKEQLIQDETILSSYTNFQVLMKVLQQSKDKSKKDLIKTFLLLLFPEYSSVILPNGIILSSESHSPVRIDDSNFEIFQDCVKQVLCVNSIFQGGNVVYNPANAAAKKIADKLMQGRRKVAQLKSNKNGNESVLTRYLSVLKVANVITTLEEAGQLTLFQLFDLMERYTAFVEWDTDLQVRIAGGKPDKTVESWMRDLHTTQNKPKSPPTPNTRSTGAMFRQGNWVKT